MDEFPAMKFKAEIISNYTPTITLSGITCILWLVKSMWKLLAIEQQLHDKHFQYKIQQISMQLPQKPDCWWQQLRGK